MANKKILLFFCLFIAALLVTASFASVQTVNNDETSEDFEYAILDTNSKGKVKELGYEIVEEYDSFVLAKVSTEDDSQFLNDNNIQLMENEENLKKIHFKTGTISSDTFNSIEQTINSNEKSYYLVKAIGPIKPEWKNTIQNHGDIVDYIPENTYVVKLSQSDVLSLKEESFVSNIGEYAPDYKISPELKDVSGNIHITINTYENSEDLLTKILPYGDLVEHSEDTVKIETQGSYVDDIAQISGISYIEPTANLKLLNTDAQWTVQTGTSGDRSIWNHGLTGDGQIVGISDTGLDYDHSAFRDPEGDPIGSNHRKVVRYVEYADDHDLDSSGHGTHTSGSIAGNDEPFGSSTHDGMAKNAKLSFYDIGGSGDSLEIPSDYADIFNPAYSDGARIHSNSWGGSDSSYTSGAKAVDEFMWNHKDMLIFYAMGNSGDSSNTVGTPATAKNIVSVGASGDGNEDVSMNDMASFSSRGPTDDGRLKPTIVAPGDGNSQYSSNSDIQSADSDGDLTTNNNGYTGMHGTSMACPVAAGSATLVREYFVDGHYPEGSINNPSAALIKSVLVNGAVEISGDGAYTNGNSFPNNDQGWGRVNLENSLEFSGDSRNLKVVDETNGISTGSTKTYTVNVADTSEPLEVSMAYTDYPGSTSASKALVNDLNLKVTAPDGSVYKGNVFSGYNPGQSTTGGEYDALNPLENVLRLNPQSGEYTIEVIGENIPQGPQPFALSITGGLGDTGTPSASFSFTPTNPDVGETVQFTDESTDSDGTIESWSWEFGDGSSSTEQNPTHSYSSEGSFTITLEVTDNEGASNSASKDIYVGDKPTSWDFETSPSDWSTSGLWHLVDDSDSYGDSNSPTHSMWYGQDSTGDYDTGSQTTGSLTSPSIDLTGASDAELYFSHWFETEDYDGNYDSVEVTVNGDQVYYKDSSDSNVGSEGNFVKETIDISSYTGSTIEIKFNFDSMDGSYNSYRGWYVDDVGVDTSENNPPTADFSYSVSDSQSTTSTDENYQTRIMTQSDIEELKDNIGVYQPGKDYNELINGHGTGLTPPSEEDYNDWVGSLTVVEDVYSTNDLTGAVDLTENQYFPPIGNQGSQGSCASWSTAYYANTYLQAKTYGWDASSGDEDHLMSPSWVYNKINGGSDGGSNLVDPMNLVVSLGNSDLQKMSYDDTDHTSWGSENAWRDAPQHRTTGVETTDVSNIDVIKSWLSEGYPVTMAVDGDQYNFDGDNVLSSSEYSAGSPNHANTLVGYDDSISDDGETGAFLIANSWGPSWGPNDDGTYYMTYDCFQNLYWTDVSRYTGAVYDSNSHPDKVITTELSTTGARDATVEVGRGSPSSPEDSNSIPWNGGNSNFPSFMCFDTSDLGGSSSQYYVSMDSASSSSTISTVIGESYTNGYNAGNPDDSYESTDTPVSTPGTASVEFSGGNNGYSVSFTDESTDSDGSIESWSWNFDDGSSSTEQNPTHSYSSSGTYTVELTVTDNSGLTDSISKDITVVGNKKPTASFSFSPTDPGTGETIQFTDESTDSDGTIESWSWNFGDGTTSDVQNPTHSYSSENTYTVELTVTDDGGATDTVTEQITVSDGSYSQVDGGDTSYGEYMTNVQFNGINKDSGDDGGYADHTTSVSNDVIPGNSYQISVTLSTAGYSEYVTVVIDWDQDYDLTNNEVIKVGYGNSEPLTVSADITVPSDAVTGQTRMRVMQEYQGYHTDPTANQDYGETEDYTVSIGKGNQNEKPTASFSYSPTSPTTDDTVQFTDGSTDSDGSISSWSWNFGDGTTNDVQNPTHSYSSADTYTVELTVTDDDGATDTVSKDITVESNNQMNDIINQDFEGDVSGWTANGLWHLVDESETYGDSHSTSTSVWYGQDSTGDYDTGSQTTGSLVVPTLDLTGATQAELSFYHWFETESYSGDYDQVKVTVNGNQVYYRDSSNDNVGSENNFVKETIDISSYIGSSVEIQFTFDSTDGSYNSYRGWYVDDVVVQADSGSIAVTNSMSNDQIQDTNTNDISSIIDTDIDTNEQLMSSHIETDQNKIATTVRTKKIL